MCAFDKQTVRDLDVRGKRVLVRVDFNVPLKDGEVVDDRRIREALPTIRYLLERGASVILMSHLGRPDGRVVVKLSLAPVASRLEALLGQPVKLAPDSGPQAKASAEVLQPGQVLLLENLRFNPGEEANDPALARTLASLGDLYVNDAFGTAHRAHASTEGVAHLLPAVAGLLMEKELTTLGSVVESPERPAMAIIGGAKVSSKIAVLSNLLAKVDYVAVGGGMANTFFKAKGLAVGKSLVENDRVELARQILTEAGSKLLLPGDAVIARELKPGVETRVVSVADVPDDWMILDVGPKTVEEFGRVAAGCRTVVWNGPIGVYETPPFGEGTRALASAIAASAARSIVGGGDLVAALEGSGIAERMSFVSTGGGASLELLEGRTLPGVAALRDR
jgi:phosphoglycerate kinase